MDNLLDFFLHLDVHLEAFVQNMGPGSTALLFLIVFAETGLVDHAVSARRFASICRRRHGRHERRPIERLGCLRAARRRGGPGRRRELRRRPLRWPARFSRRRSNQLLAPALKSRPLDGGPRVLRTPRRQSRDPGPLRAHRPHVRPVRRRMRLDVLPAVRLIQRCRRRCSGSAFASAPATSLAAVPVVKDNFELVVVAIVFISVLPIAWGYLISRLKPAKRSEP